MDSKHLGRRIGTFTIERTYKVARGDGKRPYHFGHCVCDCGRTREANIYSLRSHKCVCQRRPGSRSDPNAKSKTRLYAVWRGMITRTTSPKQRHYANYGGRGIKPDPDWLVFENFKAWAEANGYADHLSLERLDNDLGYNPANCVWIERSEQNRNRRVNKMNQSRADQLRRRYAEGENTTQLAAAFGINRSHAANIINGHVWKEPAPPCPCCGRR